MKSNAVSQRILPSAILFLFLLSNLSLTARTKPLPYSAAAVILPALRTIKTEPCADLNYQAILKKELIEKMNVMNPGNGNVSNEYEILNFK